MTFDTSGKRLLVVGAGYEGKKFIFDQLFEMGVRVVLVDGADCGEWARIHPAVEHLLEVEMGNEDAATADVVRLVKALGKPIDGLYNFWENDVALAGKLGEALGLKRCNSARSAEICKSKLLTREALAAAGLPSPKFYKIRNAEDLEEAIKSVPFPAVLKPQFGADAQGATKCLGPEDVRRSWASNLKLLNVEYDAIYKHGCDHVLEQYLDGEEVDVDLLLDDGRVIFQSITDNWPTNEPDFVNTGANLPSRLPADKQEALISLAIRASVEGAGLRYGCVHVEAKYTSRDGPHIVEINGRMAGTPYPHWMQHVWGVDLVEAHVRVALGLPCRLHKAPEPLWHIAHWEFHAPHAFGPGPHREIAYVTCRSRRSYEEAARHLREICAAPGAVPDFAVARMPSLTPIPGLQGGVAGKRLSAGTPVAPEGPARRLSVGDEAGATTAA
eukprot:tig00001576_g9360.t1